MIFTKCPIQIHLTRRHKTRQNIMYVDLLGNKKRRQLVNPVVCDELKSKLHNFL